MNTITAFRLAIALAVGLIIGMERGWKSRKSPTGLRVAGVRSFASIGLFGGMSALLGEKFGAGFLAVTFFGLALMVAVSYIMTVKDTQDFGITTELSLLITFVLGALAVSGFESEAVAGSVILAVLLGCKRELHQILRKLDRRELIATLQLLIVAAVALPLLPNNNIGPWEALNPRTIGWLVLLIAGISYIGYFTMRIFGSRIGLLATAIIGGLVSSTAVTVAYGRMARKEKGNFALLGAGISLAAATMAVRLLIEVGVVNPALLPWLTAPLGLLAIVPLVASVIIATQVKQNPSSAQLKLNNPVELGAAFGFAVVLSILFVLVRAAQSWFGNTGIYALSAISGIADVDAVSLSLAQATQGNLPLPIGATGILIAATVNTVVKALLASFIGGMFLARWCATILLSALGLSLITAFFIYS
ncbi:MgtC/SapB family protein [Mastigocoleus sp. MO_188.B34]|uniref:MgtC/SapB family protein n=1 Tax=Mastigocoleus sp. MO_188.B34 TaxID=3036635 RepID=UPI00260C663E|nr:MgtC/SapB family protein [Mastigocoleus sp. MO_188.B34]MDJ0696970.1 MgtC/SapB family protein [Mastigocoleus sp. MO_188.B34]